MRSRTCASAVKQRFIHSLVAVLLVALASAGGASAEMLKPGETFPAWSLPDQSGSTVSSSQLAGKTYLIWYYPKAMTSGCTREGQELRDHFAAFQQLDVAVYGVSFDEPAANREFAEKEKFPFPLLSDSDHKLATKVGAAYFSLQPVSFRVSYLIGGDGKVLKAYDSVDPATHAEELLKDITTLRAK